MATYLITGGAGFIGSNIAERLVDDGESVRVLDNFSTGKRENLAGIADNVSIIEGDICDENIVRRAVEGVDYVLHHAALPSVTESVSDPVKSNRINVGGALNLLIASRDAGVKRFVFAASCAAYGDSPFPLQEESQEPSPLSPYAASKLSGESYCKVFSAVYGLETVSLRYFNVFGPRQDPRSDYAAVIPKFVTTMLRGERPKIFGDGEQSRDFVFIDNVAEANRLAVEIDGVSGQIINVASGVSVTLNELVATLNRVLGAQIDPIYTDARPGDIKRSRADITKAKKMLRYEPIVGLEEGLRKTIEWYRSAGME